jgi:hypothetical protein
MRWPRSARGCPAPAAPEITSGLVRQPPPATLRPARSCVAERRWRAPRRHHSPVARWPRCKSPPELAGERRKSMSRGQCPGVNVPGLTATADRGPGQSWRPGTPPPGKSQLSWSEFANPAFAGWLDWSGTGIDESRSDVNNPEPAAFAAGGRLACGRLCTDRSSASAEPDADSPAPHVFTAGAGALEWVLNLAVLRRAPEAKKR